MQQSVRPTSPPVVIFFRLRAGTGDETPAHTTSTSIAGSLSLPRSPGSPGWEARAQARCRHLLCAGLGADVDPWSTAQRCCRWHASSCLPCVRLQVMPPSMMLTTSTGIRLTIGCATCSGFAMATTLVQQKPTSTLPSATGSEATDAPWTGRVRVAGSSPAPLQCAAGTAPGARRACRYWRAVTEWRAACAVRQAKESAPAVCSSHMVAVCFSCVCVQLVSKHGGGGTARGGAADIGGR